LQAQALIVSAGVQAVAGRVGASLALVDRAWALAVEGSTLLTRTFIPGMDSALWMWFDDPRAASVLVQRQLDQPATARAAGQRAWFLVRMALCHWQLGELEAAERALEAAGRQPGYYHLLYRQGDWLAARAFAEQQADACRRMGDRMNESGALANVAEAARLAGDAAAAEAAWGTALEPLGTEQYRLFELRYRPPLALLFAETGRAAAARVEVDRCRAIVANGEDWRGLPGSAERAEAATLAAEGKLREAEPHFERALAVFAQYGLVWEAAETQFVWGRFLGQRSAAQQAGEHFDAAIAIYHRIGAAARWSERVEQERAHLDAQSLLSHPASEATRSSAVAPRRPDGLTRRELEVLRLLAAGESNREIGESLVLSVRTVERHITDIYHRLGVSGRAARAAAAAYALTGGLSAPLRPPP